MHTNDINRVKVFLAELSPYIGEEADAVNTYRHIAQEARNLGFLGTADALINISNDEDRHYRKIQLLVNAIRRAYNIQ